MSETRNYFFLKLCVLLYSISYQGVSGLQISLTRHQTGDFFDNPYATSCNDVDSKFCLATNSICYTGFPKKGNKCCYCTCHARESTFDVKNLRCAPNKDVRHGCSLRLDGRYDESFLNAIQMSQDGEEKIKKFNLPSPSNKLLSCGVRKVEQMSSNGYATVTGHSFSVRVHNDHLHMNWARASREDLYGRVYKITFACQYKRPGQSDGEIVDCLMLKSSGTVQIYHPGLPGGKSSSDLVTTTPTATTIPTPPTTTFVTTPPPSTTQVTTSTTSIVTTSRRLSIPSSSHLHEVLPTSTAEERIKPTSTSHLYSSTKRNGFSQSSVNDEAVEISSTQTVLSTEIKDRPIPEETVAHSTSRIDKEFSTKEPKNEQRSSENDGDTMVYVIVVVVVVIVVGIVASAIVVRFTMIRKKKKKMLKKHESRVDIVMSDIKNDLNEDENGLYTALDKSESNDESNYQALNFPGAKKNQPMINARKGKIHSAANENIYADADRIYSTIDPQINDLKIGAKDNDAFDENERVYSILEQQPGQIDYTTPSMMDENAERVYSILEEESGKIAYPTRSVPDRTPTDRVVGLTSNGAIDSTSDYVTILPPENEPNQSDCSVYAELSEMKDTENNYQSLIKRKK